MFIDYYEVLGVEPSADLKKIRQAYRKQASVCHPDHGGSHARMVLINEAWSILSNPEIRARYDEARQQPDSSFAHESSAADIQSARDHAADYPRDWHEFEDWLNIVAADFAHAEYGKMPGGFGTVWPTAQNSRSAAVLIFTGGTVGAVVFLVFYSLSKMPRHGGTIIYGCFFLSCIGAWIGYWIHRLIRLGVRAALKPNPSSRSANPDKPSCVVRCPSCSQQLRLPILPQPLAVTCQKCGYGFDLPPAQR